MPPSARPRCAGGPAWRRLIVTSCPAIDTYRFDFGPFAIAGTPPPVAGLRAASEGARRAARRGRRASGRRAADELLGRGTPCGGRHRVGILRGSIVVRTPGTALIGALRY